MSSPAVLLAAVAARTARIRIGTAVTVLGTHDPVRLFEDFATLDQVSDGRAEISVGRGAFGEPFRLFGVPMEHYDEVFAEKLDLLLRLTREQRLSWRGRFRAPLTDAGIAVQSVQPSLPVWVGVSGTIASAERAGRLGLPLIIGSLGTPVSGIARLAEAYRTAGREAGHADRLRLGIGAHVHIVDDDRTADDVYPYYRDFLAPKGPETGGMVVSPEFYAAGFHQDATRYIGTTSVVIDKLLALQAAVRFDRFDALVDWGGLPPAATSHTLRILAGSVAPALNADA